MPYATLEQVKLFLGITDTSQDQLLTYLIEKSSKLIDKYCERTFETIIEERSFKAQDSPKLFISDLISLISLKIENAEVSVNKFQLFPLEAPSKKEPYRWVEFLGGEFKKEEEVKINGKWGYWLTIPEEINLACLLWTVRLFRNKHQPEGRITSESIGDYSVSYQKTEGATTERPEDILGSFKKNELGSF